MAESTETVRTGELLGPEVVELLDEGRVDDARAVMADLLAPELADLLAGVAAEKRVALFNLLPSEREAEIFTQLPVELQVELVEALPSPQVGVLLNAMAPDDRTMLLEDLPEEVINKLLKLLRPSERRRTQSLLKFPEDSVGRITTPAYVAVDPNWTAQQVLEHLRRYGSDAETLQILYVLDAQQRLIDDVTLDAIILAPPSTPVSALLDGKVPSLRATDDREEAVRAMEIYDVAVLPVIDNEDRIVGIVTFDDVADVAEEEATEDIQKLGAVEALDVPYTSTGITRLVRKRVVWLSVLFGAGLLTISAMGMFQESLEKIPMLALFVPLIIASGGNSGSQAATLIIRALALDELHLSDWWYVLRRELISGVLLGSLLAVVGFFVATFVALFLERGMHPTLLDGVRTGFAIGTSIVGVVLFGNVVGSMLPFALQRAGLDPATSSAPFVATLVDVTGLLIYFGVATTLLTVPV